MRFSLKWLLAGTVYVAIAAAAFAQPHWVYSDALWVVTFLAVVYALLLPIFVRGECRATAVGFVLSIAALIFCAYFFPDRLPTRRLIDSAFPIRITRQMNSEERDSEAQRWNKRRAASNAVTTMAAGLAGAVLGTVAYRRGRGDREGE